MRSLYFPWPLIDNEAERVLDDLARFTSIDTLLISPWHKDKRGRFLMLPDTQGLEDTSAAPPVAGTELFEAFSNTLELIKSREFEIGCEMCPLFGFGRNMLPIRNQALYQTSDDDLPHGGLIWGCPNNPITVQLAVSQVPRLIETWRQATHLQLNHIEYPLRPHRDPGSLFTCFCSHCHDSAQAAGLDLSAIKREAGDMLQELRSHSSQAHATPSSIETLLLGCAQQHTWISDWLDFRAQSMSKLIGAVVAAARTAAARSNSSLKIGMDVFLPSATKLVGTDTAAIYPLFDYMCPKFPDYLTGSVVPMLADALNPEGGPDMTTAIREALRRMLDIGPGPEQYEPTSTDAEEMEFRNTFAASIIDLQMPYLDGLREKISMYPWIWLYNSDLPGLKAKIETLQRNGFDDLCLWLWEPDMSTGALEKSHGIF